MPVDKASLAAFLETYQPPPPKVPEPAAASPVAPAATGQPAAPESLLKFLENYTPPPPKSAPAAPAPAQPGRMPTLLPLPGGAPSASAPASDEAAFQAWYAKWAKQLNLDPNPDDPRHQYDYRAAFRAGAEPAPDPGSGGELHWPSEFKMDGHPNRFVNGIDTKTGEPTDIDLRPLPEFGLGLAPSVEAMVLKKLIAPEWEEGRIPQHPEYIRFGEHMRSRLKHPDFIAQIARDREAGLTDEQILKKIFAGMQLRDDVVNVRDGTVKAPPEWADKARPTAYAIPDVLQGAPEGDAGEAFARGVLSTASSLGALAERQANQWLLPPEDSPEQREALAAMRSVYSVGAPGAALPALAAAVEPKYRRRIQEPLLDPLRSWGEGVVREATELQLQIPREHEEFWDGMTAGPAEALETVLLSGLENLPNLIVTMGASAVHPVLGLTAAWAQETGAAYQEAKEQGATEEEAQKISGYVGATNMFLEYLPAGQALKAMRGYRPEAAKGFLFTILKQGLSEGATETVQEMNQMVATAAGAAAAEGLTFDEFISRGLEAGVAGLVLGGGTGVVAEGGQRLSQVTQGKPEVQDDSLGPFVEESYLVRKNEDGSFSTPVQVPFQTEAAQEPRAPEPQAVQLGLTDAGESVQPVEPAVNIGDQQEAAAVRTILPEPEEMPGGERGYLPAGLPDRRQDLATRRRVSEMTPEEMRAALLTDDLTGLPNGRAWEDSGLEAKPYRAQFDADGLKWVNDTFGHQAGSDLLKELGSILGPLGGHRFGDGADEFHLAFDTEEQMQTAVAQAVARFRDTKLRYTLEDGTTYEVPVEASVGTGRTESEADAALRAQKAEREARGERGRRGEAPPGLVVVPPAGRDAGSRADGEQVDGDRATGPVQSNVTDDRDSRGAALDQVPVVEPAGLASDPPVLPAQPSLPAGDGTSSAPPDPRDRSDAPIEAAEPLSSEQRVLDLAHQLGRRPKLPEIEKALGVPYAEARTLWQVTKDWERTTPSTPKVRDLQGEFVDSFSGPNRFRVRGTLEATQGFSGQERRRGDAMRLFVDQGWTVVLGQKGDRRLQAPDGRFYAEKDITKTAMDFAEFLVARKGNAAAPEAPGTATAPEPPRDRPLPAPSPEADDLYQQALVAVGGDPAKAKPAVLQRALRVGYSEAARLVDRMKKEGVFEQKPTTPPAETAPTQPAPEEQRSHKLANWLRDAIAPDGGAPLSSQELFSAADSVFQGTQAEGKYTAKDATDALELGVNLHIAGKATYTAEQGVSVGRAQRVVEEIERLLDRIPTQTRRDTETESHQQFSTPPTLGYVATWAAGITPQDIVLEPSAGTGSLAALAKTSGAKEVFVNELSDRRVALLKHPDLGFSRVFQENAEQLDNVLPSDVVPTVVVMNPPFSQTAGRMGDRKVLMAGANHVEQALRRLATGGRLVAIVGGGREGQGGGMRMNSPAYKPWWNRISKEYNVRANVGIPGKVYRKYGTAFPTRVLVIDKTGPTPVGSTIEQDAEGLAQALQILEGVRNDRAAAVYSGNRRDQNDGAAPGQKGAGGQNLSVQGSVGETVQDEGVRGGAQSPERRPSGPEEGDVDAQPAPAEPSRGGTPEAGEAVRRPEKPSRPAAREVGDGERRATDQRGTEEPGRAGDDAGPALGAGPAGGDVALPGPRSGRGGGSRRAPGEGAVAGGPLEGEGADVGGVAASGPADRQPDSAQPQPEPVAVSDAAPAKGSGKTAELSDSIFEPYKPQRLRIEGAKDHPGSLVESAAMSAIPPPRPTYTPRLPRNLITSGALSLAQLEVTVYAGMAHSQMLPAVPGEAPVRRGLLCGDGTGLGKGREAASVILDNFNQGRRKAVWVSEKWPLLEDATRDWVDLGGKKSDLFAMKKIRADDSIEAKEGILFTTYDTLKGKPTQAAAAKAAEAGKKVQTRVEQIVSWLGKDWDGVLIFDESHNLANSTEQKGVRGSKSPAAKALAGVDLQKALPQARVLYVSATAATEVENLAYTDRLGLWGRGTSFASREDFVSKISEGGLGAMEMVARDLKALGSYVARSLAFSDGTPEGTVRYENIVHELTPEQREIYDELAQGWQVVLNNMDAALRKTAVNSEEKVDANAKAAAMSAFWGANLRFFNQILTAMQMPSVLRSMERDLKEGRSVVAQLINTNEASSARQLAKIAEDEDLEDFDLTPRDQLMQFVERSFPTAQLEEYEDDEGNLRMRPVVDSAGNPVDNRQAVQMREELLDKLGALRVPDGPLEALINHFGAEKVAEVTGRSRRVVRKNGKNVVESRGSGANSAETEAFNQGRKKILVFSAAGGTGRSYHASRTYKNQDQRAHYLLQAGWRADQAIQGFGRTHRTNQAIAPVYRPVSTDIAGHKRFVSTIARRLSQLGALTTGERQTAGSGIFSAKDNLESQYAKDALLVLFTDLRNSRVEGISLQDFQEQTGLRLIDPKTGALRTDLPPITQFLNRLLSMTVDRQAQVFAAFEARLEAVIESAAARGELDVGTETLRADSIQKAEERVVFTEPNTGVETRYVKLRVGHKAHPLTFAEAKGGTRLGGKKPDAFVRNIKSGAIYAIVEANNRTDQKSGAVIPQYRTASPKGDPGYIDKSSLSRDRWERLDEQEAKEAWNEAVAALPKINYRDEHLITGLLLPIWDRLPSSRTRVVRVRTDEGETFLGRVIESKDIRYTLEALGAGMEAPKLPAAEMAAKILDGSISLRLANGWTIRRRRVSNEWRIEVTGPDYQAGRLLDREGVFQERIQYQTRYFIPSGDEAAKVLGTVIETRPVAEILETVDSEDGVATLRREMVADEAARESEEREEFKSRKAQKGASEGGFINLGGKPPAAAAAPDPPKFSRPEVEEAVQTMRRGLGKDDKTLLAQCKEAVRELKNSATRPFKKLPNDAFHTLAQEALRRIGGAPDFAADYAARELGRALGNLDANERELFDKAMLLDNLQAIVDNYPTGTLLPGGFTAQDLAADRPAIDQAVAESERVQRAIGKVRDLWRKTREELAQCYEKIGMNPEFLFKQGDAYMHHQVLEYAKEQEMKARASDGVRAPKGRAWQKKLEGSDLLINLSYIEAQGPVLAQMKTDAIVAQQLARLKRKYDIKPELQKEAKKLTDEKIEAEGAGATPVSWRDIIPDGYSTYQPDNSPVFFKAVALIDAVAARVVTEGFAEVLPGDLRTILAKGGRRAEWVLPTEVVETLEEYGSRMERLRTNPYLRKAMRGWKWWQLLSPRRAPKYLTRNVVGDAGRALMANPGSFSKLPRAASEIASYLYDGSARPSQALIGWLARGGLASGQFTQEVSRAEAERIAAMVQTTEFQGFLRQLKDGVKSGAGYKRFVRRLAAFLESLLRYATYLDYQEQIAASPQGRPDNFGASIPDQVMALEDRDDRAYWLANQAIGAYDLISETGQVVREKAIPFWSFQEINIKGTYQMLRNALRDDRVSLAMAQKVGRIAGIQALRTGGYLALKVGRFLVMAYALELILHAYNQLFFEDEEDDLPEEVRRTAHIILGNPFTGDGRTANGDPRYFNRLSVFEEAREWFGLDDIGPGVMDYLAGRSDLLDTAKIMAGRPYSKLINSLGPAKLLFELVSGTTLFPDATRPRKIPNRWDHLAAAMGVEHEFRAAASLPDPSGGYAKSLPAVLYYEAEPGQAAYQDTLAVRNKWGRQTGNWRDGWMETARTEHLRNMKRALKFGQPELAGDFLAAFVAAGGTEKGLWQSVKMAHPLYGLNDEKEQALREWMSVREQEDLEKAIAYYESLVDITKKYVETPEAQALLSGEP